ncbi:MAG: SAV_915 family protein, partial [Trebonia sp.]
RTTAAGTLALRTGRLPSGERTGLAFTCQDALVRALGPSQQWTDLSWEALLDMVAPLGIKHIRVDPEPDGRPRTGNSPQPPRPLPGQPQAPTTARSTEPSASAAAGT